MRQVETPHGYGLIARLLMLVHSVLALQLCLMLRASGDPAYQTEAKFWLAYSVFCIAAVIIRLFQSLTADEER